MPISLLLGFKCNAKMRGNESKLMCHIGLRRLLWPSSVPPLPREPEGGDSTVVAMEECGSSE